MSQLTTSTDTYYTQSTIVTAQPQTIYTNTVVYNQTPAAQFGKREWSNDLFDCCGDINELACAYFCRCCYAYSLHQQSGEDVCSCFLGGLVPLRTKIRTERNIEGSIGKDVCTLMWCGICAMVQMGRELKNYPAQSITPKF